VATQPSLDSSTRSPQDSLRRPIPRLTTPTSRHDLTHRRTDSLLDEVNATRAYKDQQMGHKPPGLADAYDRAFKRRRDVGERIDPLVQSATVEHQATHQAM